MLSQRRQRVLQALVQEYIAYASPVGSKTLVDRYGIDVSPATVRNELSALEEAGYISSPHTSAGRIPTDVGYRAFVDTLLGNMPQLAKHNEFDMLLQQATEVDDLLHQTSAALTRLTDCFSMVLAPSLLHRALRQVTLVALSDRRLMIVLVTADEQVLNRSVELQDTISPEDVARIQHALQSMLPALNAHNAVPHTQSYTHELPDILRAVPGATILEEVILCLQTSERNGLHQVGLSTLLSKPDFTHAQQLVPVLKVLEDKTLLMQLFDTLGEKTHQHKGMVHVGIGSENATPEFSGVSVVAAEYGQGDKGGIVAVIGPTRMDYSHVISVVRSAQSTLNKI